MRAHLLFICLLVSALAASVKGKPHGKQTLSKSSQTAKEKEVAPEEANEGRVLPTFVTFEASSQVQEDEDLSSEDNANANKDDGVPEVAERGERSTPVLLSEEELVDLLQKESKEEVGEEGEDEEDEGKSESADAVEEMVGEEEEAEEEEEEGVVQEDLPKEGEDEEVVDEEEVKVVGEEKAAKGEEEEEEEEEEEDEEETAVGGKEGVEGEEEETVAADGGGEQEKAEVDEAGSSVGSEIPVDLDYASDSDITQPLETESLEGKPLAEEEAKSEEPEEEKQASEDEIPAATDDYESQQDVQNTEALESDEVRDQEKLPEGDKKPDKGSRADSQESGAAKQNPDAESDLQEFKNSVELEGSRMSGRREESEDEKNKNESASHTKGKTRKQKKNQRVRKHNAQRDDAHAGQGGRGSRRPEAETEQRTTDNAVHKPKRRRAGKWTPLVGMNPVQIRATVDLYPSSRPSPGPGIHRPEASADPCENFRCKRGKTCKLEDSKPTCVCQEPSACPLGMSDFDHVCGTDNTTYGTSCELFATKCNLEGTKKGHRLHLDYTGPCKFIAPCLNTELAQFPLRMRDWLKNVLLQLYDHDNMTPGFLTPKQRIRVKKISESERRLHAGDHPIELLAQDFEKNYNMYIYPVHWQFAQMDQHPTDRFLSHSELAPLRVPLVPMEHCTSRFFQECDADKDKQVSFREWAQCFGIKDEDMDVNLLF